MLRVTPARHQAAARSSALLLGLAGALGLRVAIGGADVAASLPAALVFAVALTGVAVAAGVRFQRVRATTLALGVGGGALLVAAWWTSRARGGIVLTTPDTAMLTWSALVICLAVAEEALLRGALFSAMLQWLGRWPALLVTSVLFALIHVPMYGWAALPLDLAAGLWLGSLRLLTGGWAAPAVAHAVADLAAGWVL